MTVPPQPPLTPGPPPQQYSLLQEDLLVMHQMTGFMSNNFDIQNQQGQVVGVVSTSGSAASRFFMGSRSLHVFEADGRPLLGMEDTVNFMRDTFELSDPNGEPLAHVRKRFTFFRQQVDLHLADGTNIELHGSIFDFNFEFRVGELVPARVSRQWSGLARGLLGRSSYVLSFAPDVPSRLRAAIIGGVIALDLIRAKESSN
ncbi:LURP-one-related/scramblase family protein [Corynebacterium sp. A21]|uniref:LURP-one-related/scramblase family protein n=1 Tax=Corynebacterium sp. A21 TaxID=3457318 RepID=UPI003FD187A7